MRLAFFLIAVTAGAADLTVLPSHIRSDPFGQIVAADRSAAIAPARKIALTTARAAYVSCRLLVSNAPSYTLTVTGPLSTDLHREWFHLFPKRKLYYPDALIPVTTTYKGQLPDVENKIPNQTTQSFWLDIWIPADTKPGAYTITAEGAGQSVPIEVQVLDAVVPAEDVIAIDHNSYGTSWFSSQYPQLAKQPGFYLSDAFFKLIHAYHRVFYEHRGIYHQLGYGHGGKVEPEFAPRLEGSGKTKHIADWTNYDKHYGPLFDGSAFAGTKRGPKPIPFVYLPVNPEWPASFLWWGEPGYEREFVNVMREMEAHFRQKGWTQTNFELFFNHKKRYKAFHWDGDETRFPKDLPVFNEYLRLMKLAFPKDSPVKWVYRTDASWMMERQFKEQAGVIDFWVLGGGMFGWYADQAKALKDRGDIVWIYGGTPPVNEPASHIATEVLRPWLLNVEGFVRWQTVIPGRDPWFNFEGGGETLVYPGPTGPLPSVRLKLQRNALQDLALLNAKQPANMREEAARHFNQTTLKDWRAPRPALADGNPEDWTNPDIDDNMPKDPRFGAKLDAAAWDRVREYIYKEVRR